MRLSIIAVGKIKQAGLRSELDDYLGRIRHYASCDEVELKDGADPVVATRFLRAIPERATCVALEVDGERWSSHRLAEFLDRCEQTSVPHVCWLIGGAYGLPSSFASRVDVRLSMSDMTYPHRLVRLMLAEQLYRGFSILRNEPYSH